MSMILKRKSVLSLFSALIILVSVFSFNMNTKAVTGTEALPDLSNFENVDLSATFNLTEGGMQEEMIYDEDGEYVGAIEIEIVDMVDVAGNPIEIPHGGTFRVPEGATTYKVSVYAGVGPDLWLEYEVTVWNFINGAPLYIIDAGNESAHVDDPYFGQIEEESLKIMNPIEDGSNVAWTRYNLQLTSGMDIWLDTRAYYGNITTSMCFTDLCP
ncbi:hypothetical protein [Jeotgalibacillus marinus]|uniref:Uncharacterized protein n=1 Tax=Jeotgalibacillus marinus TaxID=86667 RepID=A0ABV3Q7N3_9BACL